MKKQTQDVVYEGACKATPLRSVEIGPRAAEFVSLGQLKVFPEKAVADLALDLSRSLDCHVPLTECEAAAVSFVLALKEAGWVLFQPDNAPRNLREYQDEDETDREYQILSGAKDIKD